jgi:transcriptional regulator with XRE-family HTH domain
MPKSPGSVDAQVGQLIRAQRVALGMPQTALAKKLGLTFQQLQKYEKGTNRVSASRLLQIAEALEVDPHAFLPRNGDTNSDDTEAASLMKNISAARLVRAFNEIKDTKMRQSIVALTETLRRLEI